MFVKGEGCYLWDLENRRYLDFTAGIAVNSLGHCDPGISRVISQQVGIPYSIQFLSSGLVAPLLLHSLVDLAPSQ